MGHLRILVADDHEVILSGLCSLLEEQAGWKVIARVQDGYHALVKTRELKPDISILDISMPRLNGLDAARKIKIAVPETKVLILTMHESDELVSEALKAGASGYVTKADSWPDLILAVKALRSGKTFFTPRVDPLILENFLAGRNANNKWNAQDKNRLTSRQREIVQLLAEGRSSKEVAILLNLSTKTIESHRANVMRRLDCHCLPDLVRYALRNNIIHA